MSNELLIVVGEDEAVHMEVLLETIEELGYRLNIVHRENGQDVIDVIEQQGIPFGVILDINMPIMRGLEAARIIKSTEKTRGIPIAIFSSSQWEEDVQTAKSLGALFFRKPRIDGYPAIVKEMLTALGVGEP